VAADVKLTLATSIVLATVVVTLGAACVRLEGVAAPPLTSTGAEGSTPENATMPPAEPVDALKVQV
jgi:hypothetical protein